MRASLVVNKGTIDYTPLMTQLEHTTILHEHVDRHAITIETTSNRDTLKAVATTMHADYFIHDDYDLSAVKMIVCDMDSTILQQETLDEMAKVLSADIQEQIAAITHRAMLGDIDFTTSITQRVAFFKGLPVSIFDDMNNNLLFTLGAQELIAHAKDKGIYTVLVSGGFMPIASRVSALCGFDAVHANMMLIEQNSIAGTLEGTIIDGQKKADIVRMIAHEQSIDLHHVMCVGDGSNDVPMFAAAQDHGGLGVALHGKPILQKIAKAHINHGDLSTLLYWLQANG
jgi:phosphoserine phosphatase